MTRATRAASATTTFITAATALPKPNTPTLTATICTNVLPAAPATSPSVKSVTAPASTSSTPPRPSYTTHRRAPACTILASSAIPSPQTTSPASGKTGRSPPSVPPSWRKTRTTTRATTCSKSTRASTCTSSSATSAIPCHRCVPVWTPGTSTALHQRKTPTAGRLRSCRKSPATVRRARPLPPSAPQLPEQPACCCRRLHRHHRSGHCRQHHCARPGGKRPPRHPLPQRCPSRCQPRPACRALPQPRQRGLT